MRLAPETIDGLTFGMALAANPAVTRRREAYFASLKADREMLADLPAATLQHAITERRLWTLPDAFERRTFDDMVDAISRCMQGDDRAAWLALLAQPVHGPEVF